MARYWKEKFDLHKHTDYMSTTHLGGNSVRPPQDKLIEHWVYFVYVCSFIFQFASLEQIQQCLSFFSQKTHPSSIIPSVMEHYWQSWHERLPYWLFEEPKRQKVVKALQAALTEFKPE